MMKILHTGDLHIGKKYISYEQKVSDRYINARIQSLENIISLAEKYSCDYIVAAGDIFDRKSVSVSDIKKVCEILGRSSCPVVVIPGNHDYYEGSDDKLWNKFRENMPENTMLFTENRPFETDDAVFYPCICDSKHSDTNRLGWIKNYTVDSKKLNIGIAHGAAEGLSADNGRYYYMSFAELESCNMDLWLIGHTHMPYPNSEKITNSRIFNAGTHQPTDISDNSDGSVFIIELDDDKKVTAQKINCGTIKFARKELAIKHGQSLRDELEKIISAYDCENTSIRLIISGIASAEEYSERADIYRHAREKFIYAEIYDNDLQPEITEQMIDSETIKGSPENRLLKLYTDKPDILHLAYQLIMDCRKDKAT